MEQVTAHPEAIAELREAIRYYEHQSPGLGRRFFDEVNFYIALIIEYPTRFALRNSGIYRANLKVFPFNVNFLIEDETIAIVAIANNKRRPYYWEDRIPIAGTQSNWERFSS